VNSKLSTANPYLRDPVARLLSVFASVASSSAIEGIQAPFEQAAVTPSSGSAASTQASTTLQGGGFSAASGLRGVATECGAGLD
jgi:hypothetical protein